MTDEFHQADLDDYRLERAYDEDIRRADWDDLHGPTDEDRDTDDV